MADLLASLCRYQERSQNDYKKLDAGLRCVKALINSEPGMKAVIETERVCISFAGTA